RMRHHADIPNLGEDASRVIFQQGCQLTIGAPGASDGAREDFSFRCAESAAQRRNIGMRSVQPNVALALLLRVIKRVCMQKGPDELAADVLQAKLKMSVLINRVVAGIVRSGANGGALFFGDLFRGYQSRRVAGAGGGDGGIVGVRE